MKTDLVQDIKIGRWEFHKTASLQALKENEIQSHPIVLKITSTQIVVGVGENDPIETLIAINE